MIKRERDTELVSAGYQACVRFESVPTHRWLQATIVSRFTVTHEPSCAGQRFRSSMAERQSHRLEVGGSNPPGIRPC